MAYTPKFQRLGEEARARVELSADTLRQMGYRHARVLVGGLKAYKARPRASAHEDAEAMLRLNEPPARPGTPW